jgi:hypothetical protein
VKTRDCHYNQIETWKKLRSALVDKQTRLSASVSEETTYGIGLIFALQALSLSNSEYKNSENMKLYKKNCICADNMAKIKAGTETFMRLSDNI